VDFCTVRGSSTPVMLPRLIWMVLADPPIKAGAFSGLFGSVFLHFCHVLNLSNAVCYLQLAMTILEALAVLEAAVLECKKRNIDTPEVRAALDLLEPYIRPTWLIPQFRHHVLSECTNSPGDSEGQQQGLRATFPGIRGSVRALSKSQWTDSPLNSMRQRI
jgi:hypothetical protein